MKYLVDFGYYKQCESLFSRKYTDATFTIKSALEILHENIKDVYILSLDLVKSYDYVNRKLIWKELKIYGVPDILISLLQNYRTTSDI